MNIKEAREQLNKGRVISHRYFLPSEYIFKKDGALIDENGGILDEDIFFNDRVVVQWQTGWVILEDIDIEK